MSDLVCLSATLQALTGGTPTWFGIPVPFNLSTLVAIVRPSTVTAYQCMMVSCLSDDAVTSAV